MCDVTERLRRISLTEQIGNNRPTSPAYRASCTDPATELGVRVRSVPSSHTEFVTVDATTPAGIRVVVVNDAYRGCIGTLHSLAYGDYACVTFTDGDMSGRVLLPRKWCALIEAR